MLRVHIQRVSQAPGAPSDADFSTWSTAAAVTVDHAAELSIRLVDETESRRINHRYRGLDKPTNVLSFPAGLDEAVVRLMQEQDAAIPLGDLVICQPLVEREATEQGKPLLQHWAHLVIHGVLHLLGYDHQQDEDAERMESRETEIMGALGFPDPYRL